MKRLTWALLAVLLLFGSATTSAHAGQSSPAPASRLASARITSAIDSSSRVTLTGSQPPRAAARDDIGQVPGSTKLQGITMVFSLSAAQQTALNALLAAQQDRSSPLYHQWLTPEQYGARFGLSSADIAAVENWLQQQGFSVESVSRSHTSVSFSGTAAQVESAFAAPLHYFKASTAGATTHFAPAGDLSVPAALSSVVLAVRNLSDFRPHNHLRLGRQQAKPKFTDYEYNDVYIDSKDLQTIYDVTAAYSAGYTGVGTSIAVVGQSAIVDADINAYQSALGYAAKDPTLVLMPNTGVSTINPLGPDSGDEVESDLDLEYSSTMAPGATVYFVYTGSSMNYGVFDALTYAVDQNTAPIISSSYGDCEPDLGATEYATLNNVLAQAASQGQTIVSAAGDSGSTDCYGITGDSTTEQESLAVDFPASSQYVTAIGGTEIPAADLTSTYFAAAAGADVVSSALSYIPEEAWNDDSTQYGLSSGGGGTSIFTPRPTWQAGVTGIASGAYRLVPDISLDASNSSAPLAFCTSDPSGWQTGQDSSCTSGLRDTTSGDLTLAGGTSFGAPTFAGMLAVINQARGYAGTAGQGVINDTLYSLASSSASYSSVFHDITTGGNQCSAGISFCSASGDSGYSAGTGYDEATGLGSIDLNQLLTAWPGTASASDSSFSLTATSASVTPGTNGTSTVTLTPASSFTGLVNFTVSAPASLIYACYSLPSVTVTGTAAVTSTLTVITDAASCASGTSTLVTKPATAIARNAGQTPTPRRAPAAPLAALMAGVLVAGFGLKRRSRLSSSKLLRAGLALVVVLVLGLGASGLSGCSSSAAGTVTTTTTTTGSSTSTTPTPAGTYTITVTGIAATNSTQVSTTTFTLTVS